MEARKNKKIDLEKKRGLFFNIGLVISLVMVISAFEMKFEYFGTPINIPVSKAETEYMIPITTMDMPAPPIPKEPAAKKKDLVQFVATNPTDLLPIDMPNIDPSIDGPIDNPLTYSAWGPEDEHEEHIFPMAEIQPEPIGGYSAFYKSIGKTLKYPEKALANRIGGKVYVQFIVNKDGSLTDIEVIKGLGFGCDEEAARAIKGSIKWKPGMQRGVPVKVRMILPVDFKIQ
jgi:periplasmic protein TonB